MKFRLFPLVLLFILTTSLSSFAAKTDVKPDLKKDVPVASQGVSVPILLYHRFGPTVADGMTMKTSVFEEHLKYLRDNGYKVIPLRQLVDWYLKSSDASLPEEL